VSVDRRFGCRPRRPRRCAYPRRNGVKSGQPRTLPSSERRLGWAAVDSYRRPKGGSGSGKIWAD
jgi:hypothetical protein